MADPVSSRRSQDPGPGQQLADKTFIQAFTPRVKVFFITPGRRFPTEEMHS
jgi:hypothetical protein